MEKNEVSLILARDLIFPMSFIKISLFFHSDTFTNMCFQDWLCLIFPLDQRDHFFRTFPRVLSLSQVSSSYISKKVF